MITQYNSKDRTSFMSTELYIPFLANFSRISKWATRNVYENNNMTIIENHVASRPSQAPSGNVYVN